MFHADFSLSFKFYFCYSHILNKERLQQISFFCFSFMNRTAFAFFVTLVLLWGIQENICNFECEGWIKYVLKSQHSFKSWYLFSCLFFQKQIDNWLEICWRLLFPSLYSNNSEFLFITVYDILSDVTKKFTENDRYNCSCYKGFFWKLSIIFWFLCSIA